VAKRDVGQVLHWLSTRAVDEPSEIIRAYGAAPRWATTLHETVHGGAEVTTAGVYSTAFTAVRSWTDPAVADQLRQPNLAVERFVGLDADSATTASPVNTLLILDASADSRLSPIAPIVTTLVEKIVHAAYQRASTAFQGRWEPGLLLALDELATTCPLPSLPAICSQG